MHNENKNPQIDRSSIEHQKAPSPEKATDKRDIIFGIEPYSADALTRVVTVERTATTPGGETWPDSGWLITGEGQHPKTDEAVVKLEKLVYDESGNIAHDNKGEALVEVKYQLLDKVMQYDAEQREKRATETERHNASSDSSIHEVIPEPESLQNIEEVRPSAENPARFGSEDAVRVINYRDIDGEARGVVVGYYLNDQGDRVDLVERIDQQHSASQAEVAVLNGDLIAPNEGDEYDRLFDPNYEPGYSAEDAAVRTSESEGERLTRERRVRDAEDAANKAYLRHKGGNSY